MWLQPTKTKHLKSSGMSTASKPQNPQSGRPPPVTDLTLASLKSLDAGLDKTVAHEVNRKGLPHARNPPTPNPISPGLRCTLAFYENTPAVEVVARAEGAANVTKMLTCGKERLTPRCWGACGLHFLGPWRFTTIKCWERLTKIPTRLFGFILDAWLIV